MHPVRDVASVATPATNAAAFALSEGHFLKFCCLFGFTPLFLSGSSTIPALYYSLISSVHVLRSSSLTTTCRLVYALQSSASLLLASLRSHTQVSEQCVLVFLSTEPEACDHGDLVSVMIAHPGSYVLSISDSKSQSHFKLLFLKKFILLESKNLLVLVLLQSLLFHIGIDTSG